MAAQSPIPEFGKRRPLPPPAAQPMKRSGHVSLLVMGTLAIGGGAYALMPSENCWPPPPGAVSPPGAASPASPQTAGACTSHGSFGGYTRAAHFSFFGNFAGRSAIATASDPASGGITRGGFGSFARAFGFSGRS